VALWRLPKLIDATTSSPTPPPRRCAGSLAFLIVQNSSHVLLLRYSRICEGECKEYTVRCSRLRQTLTLRLRPRPSPQTGVAVLFAELFKLTFCVLTLLIAERGPLGLFATLRENSMPHGDQTPD
jgi:hypothetical protein